MTQIATRALDSGPAAREAAARPRRLRALTITQIATLVGLLEVGIVNVALPSIERGLGVAAGTTQWVVAGYALVLSLALIPGGRLKDALSRLGARLGLAFVAGPVIGGLILTAFTGLDDWQRVFYVNTPIGLVALLLAARLPGRVSAFRSRSVHP